jgi:hypothetical protein
MNCLIHGLNECHFHQELKENLTTQFRVTSKINDGSSEDDNYSAHQSNISTYYCVFNFFYKKNFSLIIQL